jgi:hypothetical protein
MGANTGTGYVDEKRGSVRATDVGNYNPVRATGEPDFDKTDYLTVRINDTARGVEIRAANNNEAVGTTLTVSGGDALSGNSAGGNLNLTGGAKAGTGLGGEVLFNGGNPIAAAWAFPASPVDAVFYIAPCKMRVKAVTFRPTASAAGATAVVKKAASGTAIASGTALHSNNLTLDGTAHTNQTGTLSATAADLEIAAGDAIGVDFAGTTTNATGVVIVTLTPVE